MTAGGSTADRDEVRIPAVGRDVLLDPRQRAFDVDDVVGPGVQRGDAGSSSTRTPSRAKPGGSSRDTPGGGAIRSSTRRRVPAAAPAPCRHAAGRGGARCRPGSPARAGRRTRCSACRRNAAGTRGAQRQIASAPLARGLRRQRLEFLGVIRAELFGQPGLQHRARGGGAAVADHSQDRPGRRGKGKRRFAFRARRNRRGGRGAQRPARRRWRTAPAPPTSASRTRTPAPRRRGYG